MNGWGEGEPAWWLNCRPTPMLGATWPTGRLVTGRVAHGEERGRLWSRWAEVDENLDAYAARRATETAVVILEPTGVTNVGHGDRVRIGAEATAARAAPHRPPPQPSGPMTERISGRIALPAVAEGRDVESVGFANAVVSGLLRSPLHRMLSGSTDLIRYTGRRSGREFITPTQYARHGDELIILVGRPEGKTWWRNFTSDGDIEVLLQRRWLPMTARTVIGADDPETVMPLLDVYLQRFPRAAGALGDDANGSRVQRAVIVWCRPR